VTLGYRFLRNLTTIGARRPNPRFSFNRFATPSFKEGRLRLNNKKIPFLGGADGVVGNFKQK